MLNIINLLRDSLYKMFIIKRKQLLQKIIVTIFKSILIYKCVIQKHMKACCAYPGKIH